MLAFGKGMVIGIAGGAFIGHFYGLYGLSKGVGWHHFAAAFPWWLPPVLGVVCGIPWVLLPNPGYREGLRQLGRALDVFVQILGAIGAIFWFLG